MSRFIVLGKKSSEYVVFDSEDSSIETISRAQYEKCKGINLDIKPISTGNHPFELLTARNDYSLYLPNGQKVYSDDFMTHSARGDLHRHKVTIQAVGNYKGKFVAVALVDKCFCRYKTEMPMIMVNIVVLDASNLHKVGFIYLNDAVHLVDSAESARMEYKKGGTIDYPTELCVNASARDVFINRDSISVFGVSIEDENIELRNLFNELTFVKVRR